MTLSKLLLPSHLALLLLAGGSTAHADPVRLTSVVVGELVDRAPIDAGNLERFMGAQNVALGPSAETRVFYEFSLAGVAMTPAESVRFAAIRAEPFSECASLSPCPELGSVDIYGYAGDGAITLADYDAGTLLGRVAPVPLQGRRLSLDISLFVRTLLSDGRPFAGIALRTVSQGGAGFRHAEVGVVPEPSTLALIVTGLVGYAGRHWRRRKPVDQRLR